MTYELFVSSILFILGGMALTDAIINSLQRINSWRLPALLASLLLCIAVAMLFLFVQWHGV